MAMDDDIREVCSGWEELFKRVRDERNNLARLLNMYVAPGVDEVDRALGRPVDPPCELCGFSLSDHSAKGFHCPNSADRGPLFKSEMFTSKEPL